MGPPGAWELHLGWPFAGLKVEESKQCFPWVGRGQCLSSHAQQAPPAGEASFVLARGAASAEARCNSILLALVLLVNQKNPYALRDRDP